MAEGQDQERATHTFLLCCIYIENSSLGDYGPEFFCVASDSPVYQPPGKKCNFLSDMGYSFFCQWQNTRIKRTFRHSIFLWVFEIQEHNHNEVTATAADAVVEGYFLVLP